MTDVENVIRGLEQFKSDFKPFCGGSADWKRVDDALELLKQLCEAMKPTGLRMWHDGYVGDCPSCGRVVQFAQKYCHNCTRLLDWGEVLALPCEDDEET